MEEVTKTIPEQQKEEGLDDILKPITSKQETTNVTPKPKRPTKRNSKRQQPQNMVDTIFNNELIKFDNRTQTSMFYVCVKAITIFYNDITQNHNIVLSRKVLEHYMTKIIPQIIREFNGNLKKRCKKNISTDAICLGRKLDGRQCTRKRHADFDFCKSHLVKLSNGRIDEDNNNPTFKLKRGRKRKVEFDPRQYDNEYVTLWEDIIHGEKVFVDNFNNVYTFDLNTPRFLGKKKLDFKIKEGDAEALKNTGKSTENNISFTDNASKRDDKPNKSIIDANEIGVDLEHPTIIDNDNEDSETESEIDDTQQNIKTLSNLDEDTPSVWIENIKELIQNNDNLDFNDVGLSLDNKTTVKPTKKTTVKVKKQVNIKLKSKQNTTTTTNIPIDSYF